MKMSSTKKRVSVYIPAEPADFETAISATEHGLFNYILLVIALPSCLATVYETSTMSYILPSAECDLKLKLIDKGILNAVTYAGMITSAIMWGYLADTLGRRKLLILGFLLDAACSLLGSLSPNRLYLITFKYLGGFVVCGPFAVLMAYVTEFHGIKHRGRVMMAIGCFFSTATLSLPVLAYGILPNDWNVILFDNFAIRSWKVFLSVCALPSLISGIAFIFLPESPKFLMSRGRNDEAMKVFKHIFYLNTKKSKELFPIKELVMEIPQLEPKRLNDSQEKKDHRKALAASLQAGLVQLKPMFRKPYLGHSIHVYSIQFCTLLGLNTLRLWLPQLFAITTDYENNVLSANGSSAANLCAMITHNVNKTILNVEATETQGCSVDIDNQTYFNAMIVGGTGLLSYFVAGALINAVGNKRILIIVITLSGIMGISMFWATNSLATLIISSIYVSVGSIGSTALLGIIVSLFPTSLRTMTVSLAMMFGRSGALIGNILFPIFMSLGCLPPFVMIGGAMFISAFLCCFLPSTNKKPLE